MTRTVLVRDSLLVTLLSSSIILSAFSVYEGTRAADVADDLMLQSRLLDSQTARQQNYVQTVVDHDLGVLTTYCEALIERDTALVSLLDRSPDVPRLVDATLKTDALRLLLIGDREAECVDRGTEPGYSLLAARQNLDRLVDRPSPSPDQVVELAADIRELAEAEQRSLLAALLFAIALASLIVIDILARSTARPHGIRGTTAIRWQVGLLVAAALVGVAAVILLFSSAVDLGWAIGLVVGLAAATVFVPLLLERRPASPSAGRPRFGRPQWWAELLGAFALVSFAAAALALSAAAAQERGAIARADSRTVVAQEIQALAQQEALRELAGVSAFAQLDARYAAASQEANSGSAAATAEVSRLGALWNEFDDQLHALEEKTREQSHQDLAEAGRGICPTEFGTEHELPSTLYTSIGGDADAISSHVISRLDASLACDAASDLARISATRWSEHVSTFTVMLVVLGLAGSLLAFASQHDRSRRSAVLLIVVGGAGLIVGIGLGLGAAVQIAARVGTPEADREVEFGRAFADAEVSGCDSADQLKDALAIFADYGPALDARGRGQLCLSSPYADRGSDYLSSEADRSVLDSVLDDLMRAEELGPLSPTLRGNIGWVQMLDGILTDDDGKIRAGLRGEDDAIKLFESRDDDDATGVHIARFNRALALAALGDSERAIEAYEHAARCLDPLTANDCRGGSLVDPAWRIDVKLGALADLELLDADEDWDSYRLAILGLESGTGTDIGHAELSIFPQEVAVFVDDESVVARDDVTVIWYFRAEGAKTWAVATVPSAETIEPGARIDDYVATGEALPPGEYRADVYLDGARTMVLEGGEYLPAEEGYRAESFMLGVSAVVPINWDSEQDDDGLLWHMASADGAYSLTVQRDEGVFPGDDAEAYLESAFAELFGSPVEAREGTWFLGLPYTIAEPWDGGSDAVVEGVGLAPYASSTGCGVVLFHATVTGESRDQALDVFNSLVLERPQATVAVHDTAMEVGGFAVDVPLGWDAALRPAGGDGSLLQAIDCAGSVSLRVTQEPLSDGWTLADVVDAREAEARDSVTGYAFPLRKEWTPAGVDESLYFQYQSGGDDPLVSRQVFLLHGGSVTIFTIEVLRTDDDANFLAIEGVFQSIGRQ